MESRLKLEYQKPQNKIAKWKEDAKKYEQPDCTIDDYGEPGKDTEKTIEEKWKKNPVYKYGKIIVTKTEYKKNGKNIYRVKFKPGFLRTKEHILREQEIRASFFIPRDCHALSTGLAMTDFSDFITFFYPVKFSKTGILQ